MPFRLRPRASLDAEVRRIAREEITGAIEDLSKKIGRDPAGAIHSARKHLKKLRAVIRLIEPLVEEQLAGEKRLARDAGRRLAGIRDATVLAQSARKVAAEHPGSEWAAVEEKLAKRAEGARQVSDVEIREAVKDLEELLARIEGWPEVPAALAAASEGAGRTYRLGRKAWRKAIRKPRAKSMHEWRKRVKDFWYHTRLLSDVDAVMIAREANLSRLSDILGSRHDLDVLEETLGAESELRAGISRSQSRRAIASLREELDREALMLAGLIYADRPRLFQEKLDEMLSAAGQPSGTKRRSRPSKTASSR